MIVELAAMKIKLGHQASNLSNDNNNFIENFSIIWICLNLSWPWRYCQHTVTLPRQCLPNCLGYEGSKRMSNY